MKLNPEMPEESARMFLFAYFGSSAFKKRLDLPIILKSMEDGTADLLGAGYLSNGSAHYWKLSHRQNKLAKTALKERLGLDSRSYV